MNTESDVQKAAEQWFQDNRPFWDLSTEDEQTSHQAYGCAIDAFLAGCDYRDKVKEDVVVQEFIAGAEWKVQAASESFREYLEEYDLDLTVDELGIAHHAWDSAKLSAEKEISDTRHKNEGLAIALYEADERIKKLESFLKEVRGTHMRFNDGKPFHSPFGDICELAELLLQDAKAAQ